MRPLTLAMVMAFAACETTPQRFDVIIRGGAVYDGAALDPQRVDVAVTGDRIAALGDLSTAAARVVIDARGLTVAPGFIDVQSRSGMTLLADGAGESHLRQGITTAVIGDRGSPAFWTRPGDDAHTLELFGVIADWNGIDGYFERLLQRGTALNVGTLIPATAAPDITSVDAAIAGGALGLSLDYENASRPPNAQALPELARVVARHEAVLAVRLSPSGVELMRDLNHALNLAVTTGAAVSIYQPDSLDTQTLADIIARIREARARGAIINATMTPPPGDDHAGRAYWLRESGASIGSQTAAVRAESLLAGKIVQSRAYDAFATVFARYVRQEKVIPLGEAIRRMTSFAAAHFRIEGRGLIRAGYAADLVVFDPNVVSGQSTSEQPQRYAAGVHHVIVNGVPVLDRNGLTGARPGQAVLSRARYSARRPS